jgi:hypothetical protein
MQFNNFLMKHELLLVECIVYNLRFLVKGIGMDHLLFSRETKGPTTIKESFGWFFFFTEEGIIIITNNDF